MMKSMTGYGRGESRGSFGVFKVEIKSLNNKFFDMSSKLPDGLFIFEDRIREYVQKRVKRGRVHLSVNYEDGAKRTKKIVLDKALATTLLREIDRFKKANRLKAEIDINQVIAFPGVLTYNDSMAEVHKLWKKLEEALGRAIDNLDKSRAREGENLAKDLLRSMRKIESHIDAVTQRASISIGHYKKEFARRIKELSGGIVMDKGRLEQEVAIYAKNCDITEELTRIKSHIRNFQRYLGSTGEKGKTLDFMAQELMREANTIGAKSSDFQISNHVIKIKGEIEKIREQVKNIE